MARVQGGVLAARAVKAHGVDTIFTSSGAGVGGEDVHVLVMRSAQAAAHAARAWGHVNRSSGVAFVPAGAEATGAVAESFAAQTPLVVIAGAQEFDQLSILRPITKWSGACTDADRIPEFVATAFRHALAQPRGPVYVELPLDANAEDVEARPSRSTARTFGDPREVMKAAALLNDAERPVVVAGSGVWWDGAWRQLAFFAENGRLPIFLEGSGRGALPPDHDLLFEYSREAALEAADLVCVIGAPLDFPLRDAKLVHIHADATELGRAHAPDAGVIGDCAAVLGILADGVKNVRVDREPWLERLRDIERAWWTEHRAEIESDASPIHPYRLGKALDDVLDPGTIVIADGGDAVAALLRVQRPGHRLDAGHRSAGAAYALGVKAAKPDKQVVVVTHGLNGFDYETLVDLALPVVFVVGSAADPPTHLDLLTEAFGGHGERVERANELRTALEHALASGEPAIVNVTVGSP